MPRTRKNTSLSLLKGLAAAVLITLLGMLLIAAALVWLHLPEGRIRLLNQILKIGAIILGVCVAVKRGGEAGFATGTLLALAYSALGYALYAALGGSFDFSGMLGELLIGSTVGAVTGTIRANMHTAGKKRM